MFHYYVDIVLVFKKIQKTNDVRMLAHLENLDLTTLKLKILRSHLSLGHDLDCHLLAGLLVDSSLDKTKLPFAKSLLDFVKVKKT
jgi:hypothetical protein